MEEEYNYDYEMEDYTNYEYDSFSTSNFNRQCSYLIVESIDIDNLRKNIIKECEEFTCLTKEEATIILIQYQWNMERVRDLWYEDVEENKKKSGLELDNTAKQELRKKKIVPNNKECFVCYSLWDNTFFSLKCGHNFCGDCWTQYLESKLEDVLTCISSTCPQQGCNLIVPENIFKKFIDQEKLKEFEKSINKNFTDNNDDIKWCPTPDCGRCIRSISHSGKEIECECKNVFCFRCGLEGHRPILCELLEAWNIKNNSESGNVQWLIANTKQCPNCHKYIEKNQGCNHMTCRKEAGGCGFEFCWICMDIWAPHGTTYYQCNKFEDSKLKQTKKNQKQAKFDLERYIWHFDRFMNHDKAQKHSVGMRKIIQNEIKEFNLIKLLNYDELKFLEDAVETIIKSRRTLKNTYVFGYYIKDGAKERDLFEHNQNLLEKNADRLHEMMENSDKKNLLSIDNFNEFNKEWTLFKSNVINLATVTVKYQENLLSDIENKMMELVDYKKANLK